MKTIAIAATLTMALGATLAPALAASRGGGSLQVGGALSAGLGATGASLTLGAPANLNGGASALPGNANAGAGSDTSLNASADRNGLSGSATSSANASVTGTVRKVASGAVTLTTATGDTITLNLTPPQIRALGLHPGTAIALARTANGVVLTNLDYLRSLMGRGTVRRVTASTITYVNGTGTHTIAFAHSVLNKLKLHAGSAISVRASGTTQVQVTKI